VIALSLISGSWIAVDSSGIGLLRAAVNGVPVDYVGSSVSYSTGDSNDAANVTASTIALIESVEGIEMATPLISVSSASYLNSSGGVYLDEDGQNFSGSLVFLSDSGQRLLDSYKVVGGLPVPGTAAIPKDVADSLDLKIGDDITCVFMREQYYRIKGNDEYLVNRTYLNVTSSISSIWTQPEF